MFKGLVAKSALSNARSKSDIMAEVNKVLEEFPFDDIKNKSENDIELFKNSMIHVYTKIQIDDDGITYLAEQIFKCFTEAGVKHRIDKDFGTNFGSIIANILIDDHEMITVEVDRSGHIVESHQIFDHYDPIEEKQYDFELFKIVDGKINCSIHDFDELRLLFNDPMLNNFMKKSYIGQKFEIDGCYVVRIESSR